MAIIHGDGSQANPWIVDNWTDFQNNNTSGNKGKYIQFKSPHKNYTTGEFTFEGDGSNQNPKIVSTYEELLAATGAQALSEVHLIDEDENLWIYQGETDVYCKYDSSLSTLDFDVIYPTGRNEYFTCYYYADFNGWTLLNYTQNSGSKIFSSAEVVSHAQTWIKNAIFPNASFTVTGYNDLLDIQLKHCTIQSNIICNINDRSISLWNGSSYYNDDNAVEDSSIVLTIYATGNNLELASTNSRYYSPNIVNSDITINGKVERLGTTQTNGYNLINLNRTVLKGNIESTSIGAYVFGDITNSIVDFKVNDTVTTIPVYGTCQASVYNSDKITISKSGITGVTSAQLLSPTALQSAGLPIGVDENVGD